MASIQDIETRLKTIEDRVEFIMNAVRVAQMSAIHGAPPKVMSLLDLYLASKTAGLTPIPTSEQTNG